MKTLAHKCLLPVILLVFAVYGGQAGDGFAIEISVKEDPLVRMPGTQPVPENSPDIEAPTRCLNCHDGYNQTVEPGFNWQGSMMAQASRDFLFWACLTVSAQDSAAVIGRPNATDICLRCHFPQGWLEGRSDPTNAAAMTGSDFDGVHCDVCHSMYDPFFEKTHNGEREGNDWQGYWDETNASDTPSQAAADATLADDRRLAGSVFTGSGEPFFTPDPTGELLPPENYLENGSGQYFIDDTNDKRASFADANGRHGMFYSRYHKSKYMCATCHDVSNPILANLDGGVDPAATLATITAPLKTDQDSAFSYYHVERTFSEFMLSDYGLPGGAAGIGPFDPSVFSTSNPGNTIAKCQDCHMRDKLGKGASQKSAVLRPDGSIEHPQSGQPVHDLTGGNAWVTAVLASTDPNCQNPDGSSCYIAGNDTLLNQGPAVLTLDLRQGQGIDSERLIDAAGRAMQQLELAASIDNAALNNSNLTFRIQNRTGHKLISGFPEGRRMFVNIQVFDVNGILIQEINPYDYPAGTLKGLDSPSSYAPAGMDIPAPLTLSPIEVYDDALVYEMKPTSSITGEDKTFHFALATGRYKDNRLPPKGFRIGEAPARLSVPVHNGVEAPDFFSAEEYAGGYDEVSVAIPGDAAAAIITLYYQTTSREYIEFLRDEINGDASSLGDGAYIAQTDPWFSQLAAWGDTIWQLWVANRDLTTAAPYPMATATVGLVQPPCAAAAPVLDSAVPASQQVELGWSPADGADGYNVYYDQAGKASYITDTGAALTYTDTGLTNGTQYCYKITSYVADGCESDFSNVLCATPNSGGHLISSVDGLQTGTWVTEGKGKNATTTFVETTAFAAGDEITFSIHVVDSISAPIQNATIDLAVSGPESVQLTSGPTDVDGWAELVWQTRAPNKKGAGGTAAGAYSATVTSVTATNYTWDGAPATVDFTVD